MRGDRPSIQIIFIPLLEFTPHARGSTWKRDSKRFSIWVYPACAGIDPQHGLSLGADGRLPRMRGDRPRTLTERNGLKKFTPHARGSTEYTSVSYGEDYVYPACAGIDPSSNTRQAERRRLPRMRGDRPRREGEKRKKREFTPHARGSTPAIHPKRDTRSVYPACAGIDPQHGLSLGADGRLPRMRGDRPAYHGGVVLFERFTPHARGSTLPSVIIFSLGLVYPACAGIDLTTSWYDSPEGSLPRMRGDRPLIDEWEEPQIRFTPHARGSTFHSAVVT